MIRYLKHIVRIIIVFALIMCWGISLGYANNIGSKNKTLNFYFENENYNVDLIKDIKKSQPELSVVGWIEETLQTAENPDLGKIASDLDILTIKGSSNLLVKGSNLFVDDLDGCLIDSDTSYKLFGSSNCVGKEIIYNDRHLIVRGILKGSKANIMIQAIEGSSQVLNGLIIDGTGLTLNKIEDFKMKFGINEMAINGNVYYIISKFISLIFPVITLVLILIKIIASLFKSKNKPVLVSIYILMAIASLFIFFKITNIKISIPLDMIPNKWSDFDFWSKMAKEYKEKFEYVLYMKKYGVDIYNIENLLKVLDYAKNSEKIITFGTTRNADVFAYNIEKKGLHTSFKVKTPYFNNKILLTMPGLFNIENALAAIAVSVAMKIPYKNIYEGLKVARSSGRMELYTNKDKKIIAIVDYAHNKLSFEKLYESTIKEYPDRKIVTVFGCPGGHAIIRRRDLGVLSGLNSDITYLTAEDPGMEKTEDICEEIAGYVKKVGGKYKIIEDRGEAIKTAIMENPDSVILITGKGNETRQKIGTTYVKCLTDVQYAKNALKEYDRIYINTQNAKKKVVKK